MSQTGKATVRCQRCGKRWPSATEVCPDDGTRLHAQVSTAAPWNTAIDAPFNGSLTDLAKDVSLVRASGSMSPAEQSLGGPTNVVPQRAATSELTSDMRVGEYTIEGKIGEGAMGTVYRATHPTIGKKVAVKIMSAKLCDDLGAVERFTREARSVAAIRHPGIVDVFGFGTLDDGRAYLIMEWLDGTSLGARLEHGAFTLNEALDVLGQIARALEAAHDEGIIHRDLKPDNVFLQHVAREKPIIKILDFGLAKLVNGEEGRVARTQTGQLLGTPLYMSPEQCRAKDVDHRTDIYALGCIAYELICGRVPFDADNTAELIAAHLSELPPPPSSLCPEISPQLDDLLFAMLAKDPEQRPALQQIRQTIAALRGTAYPTPVPGELRVSVPSAPVSHARRYAAVALAVLVVVAGIGVTMSLGRSNVSPPDAMAAPAVEPVVDARVAVTVDAGIDAALPLASEPRIVEKPVVKKPIVKKPVREKSMIVEKKPDPVIIEKKPNSHTTTINPFKKKPSP